MSQNVFSGQGTGGRACRLDVVIELIALVFPAMKKDFSEVKSEGFRSMFEGKTMKKHAGVL